MDSVVQHKSKYIDHNNKYSHPPNAESATNFILYHFGKPLST